MDDERDKRRQQVLDMKQESKDAQDSLKDIQKQVRKLFNDMDLLVEDIKGSMVDINL